MFKLGSSRILLHTIVFFGLSILTITSSTASDSDTAQIELVGTITGKHALAILRISDQSDGIYQVQQSILGFTITSITKKFVVLEKHHKSTTLSLVAVRHKNTSNNHISTPAVTSLTYRINRKTFNSLQKDTQSWLNDVRMVLQIENGYLSAYKITYVRKDSPAELLGIAEGDLIKGLNGILIKNNADEFIKKISELANANQLTLNMSQNGVDFKLQLLISDD